MFKKKNFQINKKSRVIILGSGGFISSQVEKKLKKNKTSFIALKRKKADLTKKNSKKLLKKIIKDNDSVLFIAARAPVKTKKMLNDNLKMAKITTSVLKQKKIRHFIYISSDAVYSDIKKPIREKSKTIPNSLHGIIHIKRENIFKKILKNKICIIRPTLIFGKNDPHNGYGPNRFLRLAKKNKEIKLFGKGEERRDHIFLNDVSTVIVSCIKNCSIGTLNVVSGKVISFKNLAKMIIRYSGSSSKIINTIRIGKMPHNGYRPFNPYLLRKNFPKLLSYSTNKVFRKFTKDSI